MDADTSKKLRAPFPADVVGKLPRITCPKCRDARGKACDEHKKQSCRVCGNWITPKHLHLDFIGHAETTDRLLQVDPGWSWEPMACDERGLPVVDGNGGLWIRLTVAGVTRIGYGHADGKSGPDAVKEAIGDALRNAAMRFGVALDLWGAHGPAEPNEPEPEQLPHVMALTELGKTCDENGWDRGIVAQRYAAEHDGQDVRAATDVAVIEAFRKSLFALSDGALKVDGGAQA